MSSNSTPEVSSDFFKDYFEQVALCMREFGPNTIVLSQVGSFYESYDYLDANGKYVNNSEYVAKRIINITFTRKNKNKPMSSSNPANYGFKCEAIDKYLSIMLENNYIVVLYDQLNAPHDAPQDRQKI